MSATQPYQLTPRASKRNAFCWMSWQPECTWQRSKPEIQAQGMRDELLRRRSEAGEPMHSSTLDWRHYRSVKGAAQ